MLTCGGVKEVNIRDLDGGGIQLSPGDHPAARQYTDDVIALKCSPPDLRSALGVLFEAHVAAVDDWIDFDRYLGLAYPAPSRLTRLRLVGPRFLMTAYARALRRAGIPCVPKARNRARRARQVLGVLHFGSSSVVAHTFKIEREPPVRRPRASRPR